MSTAQRTERRPAGHGRGAADRGGRLTDVVAARCRGRTLLIGRGPDDLAEAIEARGLRISPLDLGDFDLHDRVPTSVALACATKAFKTIVLIGVLERLPAEAGDAVIAEAWRQLKPGGRLLVVVPNEDCIPDDRQVRRFDRRGLKKTFRPLEGKCRFVTEQPFRWLFAEVKKPRDGRPRRYSGRERRYRVTADLCRGKVIELGCGSGDLAKSIHDRGPDVVGVDINREKIQTARERYPEIQFIHSDIRDLDIADGEFDTVVLAEVLEHLPADSGAEILARAARLLRPGGRLIVSVPNEDAIPHPNHVRMFDREGLEKLLQPLGRPRLVCDQPFKWLMMYVESES